MNLAGLYIQIEAKKRRIYVINLWKVPKWGLSRPCILRPHFRHRQIHSLGHWAVYLGTATLRRPSAPTRYAQVKSAGLTRTASGALLRRTAEGGCPHMSYWAYLCSKSTGAVTSCTRKYLASAGYFRATASYMAYATLRYEMCPAGVVRNSEI